MKRCFLSSKEDQGHILELNITIDIYIYIICNFQFHAQMLNIASSATVSAEQKVLVSFLL